jgi:hypothetical protein
MNRKLSVAFLAVLTTVALATAAYAGRSAKGGGKGRSAILPLEVVFQTPGSSPGVFDDGAAYTHGVGEVQCYLGVSRKDADLVTYNSDRKLHFIFDPSSQVWRDAGLDQDFSSEVDFFGINYWGRYDEMAIGSTAQVQADLEFYVGRITYELDYPSLAVQRIGAGEWLITSDPGVIGGDPGFTASAEADLNVIRRRKQETFGVVQMPIQFVIGEPQITPESARTR